MSRRFVAAVVACLCLAFSPLRAQDKFEITVAGGKQDLNDVPVCVPLSVAKGQAEFVYAHVFGNGQDAEGQLTAPGLATESIAPSAKGLVRRDLHFVMRSIKKGESLTFTAKLIKENNAPDTTGFFWLDQQKGEATDLIFDVLSGVKRRPVLRYMHKAFDDSSKQN